MAAQPGRDMLIKLDAAGTGSFTTVAGLRSTRLALNSTQVDITTAESAGQWRELLANAGMRSATLTGAGVFRDAASDAQMRTLFWGAGIANFQVIIPDFGRMTGPFQITALDYAGTYDGEAVFELTLASAGALTFEAI